MKKNVLAVLKHRFFFFIVLFLMSTGVVFYAYTYHIKEILDETETIKKNINSVNKAKIKNEIAQLKKKKKKLQSEFKKVKEGTKIYAEKIYKDKYNIVLDTLEKLNNFSFNIYSYTLSKEYDSITFKISGSYLNLIKFFDFLQTIKAEIVIESYKIELKERKMYIDLKIKIGIMKI